MLCDAFGAFRCGKRVRRLITWGRGWKSWCTVLSWCKSHIACCSTAFDLHASAQFSDHGTCQCSDVCDRSDSSPLHLQFQVELFCWECFGLSDSSSRAVWRARLCNHENAAVGSPLLISFFLLWHFTCAGQFGPRTGLRCVSMYIDSKCLAAIGWHGKSQCFGHLRGCRCSVRNKLLLKLHCSFVRDQCAEEMWLPLTTLRRLAEERQPKSALAKLSRAWLFNGCSAGMFPSAWSTGVESGLLLLETF